MQCSKFMVGRRHQLHKMLMHHFRIRSVQGAFHISINNALFFYLFTHIMIYYLGIILCAYTGQTALLCLRNTQTIKGVLNIFGNIFPFTLHVRIRTYIGNDVIHIQTINRRSPVRHLQLIINIQGFQTEFQHPFRIMLFTGNFFYNLTCQAFLNAVSVLILVTEVVKTSVYIINIGFFFHIFPTSYSLFCKNFSKPFLLTSSTSSGPAFLIICP